MTESLEPAHLPTCPIDPEAYDRLYEFNRGADCFERESDWQEIRIHAGLTEEEVYRRLPCAGRFEYGGYLTKSRIRFFKSGQAWAYGPKSKACTFHSHPTDHSAADLPSASDVYLFLAFRNLRAITIGSTRLWVWDKTRATLDTVKTLGIWSKANFLSEVHRLEKKYQHAWQDPLVKVALKHLGLDWPKKHKDLEANWQEMLRKILKIKVRVFSRNP